MFSVGPSLTKINGSMELNLWNSSFLLFHSGFYSLAKLCTYRITTVVFVTDPLKFFPKIECKIISI